MINVMQKIKKFLSAVPEKKLRRNEQTYKGYFIEASLCESNKRHLNQLQCQLLWFSKCCRNVVTWTNAAISGKYLNLFFPLAKKQSKTAATTTSIIQTSAWAVIQFYQLLIVGDWLTGKWCEIPISTSFSLIKGP